MYNHVTLVGNLTRDPEMKYTPNNKAVCSFGIAANRKWGESEEVFFGEIEAWGKTAENVTKYLQKGARCLISGRLKTHSWETQEGTKRSKTRIVADQVVFLSPVQKPESEPQGEEDMI